MLKLNLGCGPLPIHPQHYSVMEKPEEWTLVDFYVKDPSIKNWDAEKLEEVENGSCEAIYASHLLEHISHRRISEVLTLWYNKLCDNGQIIINVPDLLWASREVIKYENDQPLSSSVYTSFEGNTGLQSIFYGTHAHEGEVHKAGFTQKSLTALLESIGFKNVAVTPWYDAHDMGVLMAWGIK